MRKRVFGFLAVVLVMILMTGCASTTKEATTSPATETTGTSNETKKVETTKAEEKTPVIPAQTPEEFKAACGTVAYEELARFPDRNKAKQLVMTGEIIQVTEDETGGVYRLKLNDDYEQIVMIIYQGNFDQGKILNGDTVTFWGKYGGTITYESTMGGRNHHTGSVSILLWDKCVARPHDHENSD